jgi:hypothetical protein
LLNERDTKAVARVRRWRAARIVALVFVAAGFFGMPIGLAVRGALSLDPSMSPHLFRVLALGSLASIPLAAALFLLAQRRLLLAALAEPMDGSSPSTVPVGLTGGAQDAFVRVGYPLARLTIDPSRLSLRILGRERFTCERADLSSITQQRWLLGSGITIGTRATARAAMFWPLDPVALVRALRGARYEIDVRSD